MQFDTLHVQQVKANYPTSLKSPFPHQKLVSCRRKLSTVDMLINPCSPQNYGGYQSHPGGLVGEAEGVTLH